MAEESGFEQANSRGFIEGFSRKSDPKGMLSWVEDWPGIVIRGQDEFILKEDRITELKKSDFENIVFSGMGGSAMACEIIMSLLGRKLDVPTIIAKDYGIPSWVNEKTLFIPVSYSGNTEEVIWNTTQAFNAGAKIIGLSSGGVLKQISEHVDFEFVKVYGQCPTPRAALGYLLMPLIKLMADLGFFDQDEIVEDVTETIKTIIRERKKYTYFLEEEKNFAKKLSREIRNSIPIIWAESTSMIPVAARWQQQLNENSKALGFAGCFPDVNHNQILAFQFKQRDWLVKDVLMIILRDSNEHPRISLRIDFTTDILRPIVKGLYQIKPKGKSKLCRYLTHIQVADYVSVYLALLNKIDPSNQNHIDELKKKLSLIK